MASPNDKNGAAGDQSGLPEWARIQADLPTSDDNFDIDPAQSAPTAPAAEQPVKPVAPARPRRTTPPAPAAPAVPVPVPAQPVPVPAVPVAPVAEPTPVPAPTQTPAQVPAPAVNVDTTPVAEPVAPKPAPKGAPVEAPLPEEDFTMEVVKPRSKPKTLPGPVTTWSPAAPAAAWEQAAEEAAEKSKKFSKGAKKAKRANAGGRWKVLAVRYSVYATVGLVMLLGVIRIVNPNPINIATVTQSVLSEMGRNGFPLETGQQLGARFVREYLTYDALNKNYREEALNSYYPKGNGGDFTFAMSSDPSWSQSVIDGPYLVSQPDVADDTHIALTYAALVKTPLTGTKDGKGNIVQPEWIYVSVAMSVDDKGHVAVSGPPAFVPAPQVAEALDYINEDIDSDASEQATPRIAEFLDLWAKATPADQVTPQNLTDDASDAARNGLRGLVTRVGDPVVGVVAVADKKATERTANVVVTWQTKAGMKLTQSYRMTIVNKNGDQYWFIKDIQGASFNAVG